MKKVVISGVSILLACSAILSPYWFGGRAELAVNDEILKIKESEYFQPWLNVDIDSYERGWFSSTVKTTVEIDLDKFFPSDENITTTEPLGMVLIHEIKHGPISGFKFAIAEIESTIVVSDESKDIIEHYFDQASPIKQTTLINFDKTSISTFSVPAFSGRDHTDQFNIDWQGLDATVLAKWDTQEGEVSINIPSLKLVDDSGDIELSGFRIDSPSVFNEKGLMLDSARFSIKELSYSLPERQDGKIIGINYSVIFKNNNSLIDVVSSMSFEEIEVGDDFKFGPGGLSLEINNIDVDFISALEEQLGDVKDYNLSKDEFNKVVALVVKEQASKFLKSSPGFKVNKLEINTEKGGVVSSFDLSFDGSGKYDLDSLESFIPLITLNIQASIDTRLLISAAQSKSEGMISSMMRQRGQKIDQQDLEEKANNAAVRQLAQMEEMNFLVKDGLLHTAKLNLKHGKLLMNGEPADKLLGALPIQ